MGLVFVLLVPPPVHAQEIYLPAPGVRVSLSPAFNPPILKGLKVHPDNPFRFDFILDVGDGSPVPNKGGVTPPLQEESMKLIKYFLASLTVPEKDLWVNLSPYEKDRIIPQSFGLTEMGRDLLAQDYLLKQITASLIYPEDEFGKKFWNRIYQEAAKRYGTTNIPVNTFNKVWIIPEKAVVYENAKAGTAYVVESRLKVMLEEDYLALQKSSVGAQFIAPTKEGSMNRTPTDTHSLASSIVREIVIPQLTKEINENKNFAQLRQVYNSLILATWYKKKIKESILSQVYADKNKVKGVEYKDSVIPAKARIQDKTDVEGIYQQYLKAFKKGVYNYIKEEPSTPLRPGQDPQTQQMIPRKYFSGGVDWAMFGDAVGKSLQFTHSVPRSVLIDSNHALRITVRVDAAMTTGNGNSTFYFNGLQGLDQMEIRRAIFGKDIEEWLIRHEKNGNKEEVADAVVALLQDQEFVEILRSSVVDDVPIELIRFSVKNKFYFGTKSLSIFLRGLKAGAKGTGFEKKIPVFSMPIFSYVQLITALADPRVQKYLDEELLQKPASERLRALVAAIRSLGLPLNTGNYGQIYSGLPDRLSKNVKKDDVQKMELPEDVDAQLQAALGDGRIQAYLESAEFLNRPMRDRLAALISKIKSLGFNLKNSPLFSIYPVLPDNVKGYVLWPGRNDQAMTGENTGGIDFNSNKINLQIKNNGEIKFHLNPTILEQLQNAPGFVPVIINIQPLNNLSEFLGING